MTTKYLPAPDSEASPQENKSENANDWMTKMCANVSDASLRLNLPRVKGVLVAANTIPDVKRLQEQAAALQKLVKQQHLHLDTQNDAAEIRLCCIRKLGKMLADMKITPGGGRRLRDETAGRGRFRGSEPLLPDEITKVQAHRWRRAASVPEALFVAWVDRAREERKGAEPTG